MSPATFREVGQRILVAQQVLEWANFCSTPERRRFFRHSADLLVLSAVRLPLGPDRERSHAQQPCEPVGHWLEKSRQDCQSTPVHAKTSLSQRQDNSTKANARSESQLIEDAFTVLLRTSPLSVRPSASLTLSVSQCLSDSVQVE